MPNVLELKQQAVELKNETATKLKEINEGKITLAEFTQYMNGNGDGKTGAVARDKDISDGIKAYNAAMGIQGGQETGDPGAPPERPMSVKVKKAQENWAR